MMWVVNKNGEVKSKIGEMSSVPVEQGSQPSLVARDRVFAVEESGGKEVIHMFEGGKWTVI